MNKNDKKTHLASVEEMAKKQNIVFEGIHYTAVKETKLPPLDKNRAHFQFDVLEKEQKWLGDEEATLRMQNRENTKIKKN